MALTQLNQLAISFKKLAGKAHTNSGFGIGNEAISSILQVGSTTIFGEPIPTTSIPSSLYGINGPVEKIRFQLTSIAASQYTATNPGGLTGATINASGDGAPSAGTFTNGLHAYKLSLPSDYVTNSSNPRKGTSPFTNSSVIADSAGGLQIVPDSFAADYSAVVYDSAGVIFPGDQDDYYLDYSTGVLFVQDIVSGQPPIYVEAYLYIGKYLADPTLSYSGSFSGSFQGDGSGLTNVPASGIVGLNLSRTATGSVTASVDVGSTSFQVTSGSSTLMSVTSNGKIAVSKSINVGTPTVNPWGTGLQGSYFNNFTSGSDVADILRFIAGLLSASAPDAAPNTKTWASTNIDFNVGGTPTSKTSYMSGILAGLTNARLSQEWNQSNAINIGATGSYRRLQSYLIGKGWMNSSETGSNTLHDVGTHPFGTSSYGANIPSNIYSTTTFGTFTFNADSVNTSTTVFSSSIGADAFGLGSLVDPTTVTPYSVYISTTQSFSDTASITTPTETSTYTTSSNTIYTLGVESLSGTNGLYLGIISTGNSLIPNAYQDGKFLNTPAGYTGRKWSDVDADRTTGATTSSIGYYRLHGLTVGLTSGSQVVPATRSLSTSDTTGLFYMPSLGTLEVSNITQNDPTVIITGNANITAFTATSRSLSGAPYLLTTTYTIEYNTQVSKSFDPCYGYSQTPLAVSKTDGWDTVGATTLSNTSVSVTTAGIQTSAATAGVFPAGTGPASRRSLNTIPAIGDVAFASSSYTFTLDSNFYSASANYNLSFTTTGKNWKDASTTSTTSNISFYDATRFGQPSSSGSMAIYSRAQTYDNGTYTLSSAGNLSVDFSGESRRLQITDKLLSGSYSKGDSWNTSFGLYNLGGSDLQVKPGSLVKPGSATNGYWITDPDSSKTLKYYAVGFTRNINSNQPTITLTLGGNTTLVEWTDNTTSNAIAALLIPESSLMVGSTARGWDFKAPSSTVLTVGDARNPFSRDLSVEQNTNPQKTNPFILTFSPTYPLNSTYTNFVLLVRYNGDPTPLTSITFAVS